MSERPNGLTYAQAGVDIDAGAALVERIKPLAKATMRQTRGFMQSMIRFLDMTMTNAERQSAWRQRLKARAGSLAASGITTAIRKGSAAAGSHVRAKRHGTMRRV